MILLKSNGDLHNVFSRLIKTMGVNVAWTGNFVALDHFLILPGSVRSLVFNFENRKVGTNIIELPDDEESMEPVADNETLTNVLNMTLYAFGKWGVIRGLKVDKDYNQLSELFTAILKDMRITPGFRDDNFRFYKDNLQITYEEVVAAAIVEGKRKAEEIKEEGAEEEERSGLGLWHKMRWIMERATFLKEEVEEAERESNRMGNNFYLTGYLCPGCKGKMHMCVYPQGQEFPIETEEGRVYLARSYTCGNCGLFYTPRPKKLLREGDAYVLRFGGDRDAYGDYLELLGSKGERTSNCNFNEYAADHGKGKGVPPIEEACADMERMGEKELEALEDKLEDGFFPLARAKAYRGEVRKLLGKKRRDAKAQDGAERAGQEGQNAGRERRPVGEAQGAGHPAGLGASPMRPEKTRQEAAVETGAAGDRSASGRRAPGAGAGKERESSDRPGQVSGGNGKYGARMNVLGRMSLRQLRDLKGQIQSDGSLGEQERAGLLGRIAEAVGKKEEEAVRQKAKDVRDKPYPAIVRAIEEIGRAECPESVRQEVLAPLKELRQKRAQEEAERLIAGMPAQMGRNQYRAFREKLAQYQDADLSAYEGQLEEKQRQAAEHEVAEMLRRAGRAGRGTLVNMLEQLKSGDFPGEQAELARKEIEDRIRALDEKAIDKICPDLMGMTFDEAAEAYEKIEAGAFLPELKTNTLEMLDKRLTKLKMDECGLLVEKLKEELKGKIKDPERLHFYEVRKVMRGSLEQEEAELVANALNTYASERGRYEFPILICDSSGRKNGKEGFVLTPDHIFYNSTFNSEMIPVRSISKVEGNTGLLNRGIYVSRGGARTKIPGGIPAKELGAFAGALDRFVAYLKEKPESRSISYLAKEKHEVKCCYRCGFTYREGNVCPKCGNQANR